ncbi:RNA-binding domain-containing protein [Clostridium sp. JN-1]|jgi:predicted HTH transcriptional regulator|uniref:AlbA family DNA-binding domain-containing protein n=1 Tax=Clostridium sp. JN-1 TaxID=2483110 RepID=UPI000F0B20AD|nr:RNA-binding domain-containing protein [Clostridium sp. JN-1]
MDKKRLVNLLKKPEGPKLDFKRHVDIDTDSGRKELAKDVCAIANSRGGRGYLIIGVEDKTKEIVGVDNLELGEEKIQQIISSRIDPPVPVYLEFMEYHDKKIAIINIYDGPQKPYQMRDNGAFYTRRGSTTDTMRKQEIVSALQDNLNLDPELCPIARSDLSCLDMNIIYKYFNSQAIDINDDNKMELMESASIIYKDKESNKYMVTLGGILVFSKINNIYVPYNMVKIVNKIDDDKNKDIIIQGDLLSILDKSELILKDILPETYPINAVNEGIKNAVLYRDYTIYYKVIEIVISYKSIVIKSPGILIKNKSLNSVDYLKRNIWMYEKMIALDNKKRFLNSNNGFKMMRKAFKNKGRVYFANSFKKNEFKVIYPGIKGFE